MSKTSSQACFTEATATRRGHTNVRWISGLLFLALLLGVWPARADGPDDEYLQIRGIIQQADELNTGGKAASAKLKYEEARAALMSFQRAYPEWNVKLVAFRLNSVVQKVAALTEKPPTVAAGDTATPVKLLEPGTEPRKVLRLHPSAGDKQTLDMTMKMAMETKMGETESPAMKLPAIKISLEATVKAVADNGDITCEMVMGDLGVSDEPGVTPEVAAAMKSAFNGIKGLSGSGTISSRGLSQGLDFKAPADISPQARQFVEQLKEFYAQLAVPLPEEAVGPGAKWEVKMPIKAQGMTIDQAATYEVVSIEGESLTTKSTIIQQATNQKVQNPAMPGLKMDLTKMVGKGAGERTFNLAKLLPTAGTGGVHTEATMAMNMGGQKQAISTKMDVNIQFEAK